MNIGSWLINLLCNGLLTGTVEFFFYKIYRRKKENKYESKEELKENITNLIDTFYTFLIPCIAILLVNNTGISFTENNLLFTWGILFFSIAVLLVIKLIFIYLRKNEKYLFIKEAPSFFYKLMELYEEDEVLCRYFVKEKSIYIVRVIELLESCYIIFFVATYDAMEALELGVTAALYPVLILFLVAEIKRVISGYTVEEYCKKFLNCDVETVRSPGVISISDNVIQQLKRFKLLVKSEYFGEEISFSEKKYYDNENEYEQDLFCDFLKCKNYYEGKLNLDYYIAPTVYLLKKQNVIFNTFFYRDLGLAIFFPMMISSFRGKKSLMVIDNANYHDEIGWVTESIEEMCGISTCVKCSCLPEAEESDDIIILDYNQLLSWREIPLIKRLAFRIDILFLVEPSLRTIQELKEINAFKAFIENSGGNASVVIADSQQEIVERMMWTSDSETMYKGPYRLIPQKYTVILWDADSSDKQEFASNEIEMNIIRILQEKIKRGKILWIDQNVRPSLDLWWQFRKKQKISDRIELHHLENGRELTASKDAYYIIEDAEYNYLTVEERFLSRAEERGIVCIMEPNYMLRNYLLLNSSLDKSIKDGIKGKIISEALASERNYIFFLICRLYIDDIDLNDIEIELSGESNDEKVQNLKTKIEMYFSFLTIDLESKYDKKTKKICKFNDNNTVKELVDKGRDLLVYRGKNRIEVWNNVNYYLIYQKHLPGQNIIIRSMCYTFLNMEVQSGKYIVKVQRNLDNIGRREYYRQKRKYCILKDQTEDSFYECKVGNLKMKWRRAGVTCNTEGYIKMPRFNDFYDGKFVQKSGIPIRKYDNKNILIMQILGSGFTEQMLFAVILKEIMYTLCPEYVDYLGICIAVQNETNALQKRYIERGVVWEIDNAERGIYVIEDHIQDLGIVEAIERKIEFIMELIVSYIEWYIRYNEKYLLFGFSEGDEELKKHLISLKQSIERKDEKRLEDEEKEREENNFAETKLSKEEAKNIFAEVLVDMFWFRDLNVNIAFQPIFRNIKAQNDEEKKKKKQKSGYVYLNLNVSRKQFYKDCAYGIIKEFNEISGKGLRLEECNKYAQDYVNLLFMGK